MAIEVGEAYVSIIPSARGFSGHLSNLIGPAASSAGASGGESAASSFLSAFAGGIGKIAGLISGAIAAAGIGKAIHEAFSTTADFEVTKVAFEGMLGSTEAATKALSDLQKFAQKTPFTFPELSDASRKLLAVGYDTEQVIPIMNTLGNAAAAVGAKGYDINLVVRALGQIKGKGRVMQEEINQIAEALPGFNPLKAIAEQSGIAFEELQTNIGKPGGLLKAYGITGAQAADMIIAGMDNIRGASGAMERQNKTLRGSLSNLSDALRITAINTLLPFFPGIADVILNKIVPAVERLGATLPPLVAGWVADLQRMYQSVRLFASQVVDAFKNGIDIPGSPFDNIGRGLRDLVEGAKLAVDAFKNGIDVPGDPFDNIGRGARTALEDVKLFLDAFVNGTDNPGAVFDNLGRGARNAYEDVKVIIKYVDDHKDVFTALTVGITAGATALVAYGAGAQIAASGLTAVSVAKSLLEKGGTLGSIASQLLTLALAAGPIGILIAVIVAIAAGIAILYIKWKPFHEAVNNTAAMIRDVAVAAFYALAGAFTTVKDALVTAYNTVVSVGSGVAQSIITALQPVTDWITGHLFPAIASVAVFFAVLFQQIYAAVSGTISAVMTIITPWLSEMLAVMQIGFTLIWGAIQLVWTQIVTAFQVAIDILTPIWSFFWDQIYAVMKLSFELVATTVTAVLDVIKGVFSAATAVLRGDWSGFWDAIKSIAETLFGATRDTIANVLDTIKSLFQNTLGLIPGIISGVASGVRDAMGGIVSALQGAVSTIEGLVGRIKSAISSIPGAGVVGNIAGAIFGAEGGIIRRPTLMVVGEAGPEAVVPLGMFGAGGTLPPLRSYVATGGPGMSDYATSTSPVVNIYAPLGVDRKEVIAAVATGLRSHDAARRGS
jgi:tape measure domain-containing protein